MGTNKDSGALSAELGSVSPVNIIVLHADVDAFFCQVEVLRRADGALHDVPLAVQQHQDIIAVDYRARQAGVQKHMAPEEARRLLATVGGRVVQVYRENGIRPSYRPYREISAAFMRLLRALMPPDCCCRRCTLEAASIDEAYIQIQLIRPPCQSGARPAPPLPPHRREGPREMGWAVVPDEEDENAEGDSCTDAKYDPWVAEALRLGEHIRRESWSQLGLRVSVGVARNKLLSKLASRAAKPDGLRALLRGPEVEAELQSTPVSRLPGVGGRGAEALAAAGYTTAARLRALSREQLAAQFGLRPAVAECAVAWARGQDPRPVRERGPPQAILVQLSLTPVPRSAPPAPPAHLRAPCNGARGPPSANANRGITAAAADAAAATALGSHRSAPAPPLVGAAEGLATGSPSGATALLMPLLPDTADGAARLCRLMRNMAGDLVARVLLDRHLERRWPGRLTVQLVTHGSEGRTASKTRAFPPPALAAAGGGGRTAAADGTLSDGLAAAGSAAAASVPAGVCGLLVGEHTSYLPGSSNALLDAVVAASLELCSALLPAPRPGIAAAAAASVAPSGSAAGFAGPLGAGGPPLVQVHLMAHSFTPLSTSSARGPISQFLVPASGGSSGGGERAEAECRLGSVGHLGDHLGLGGKEPKQAEPDSTHEQDGLGPAADGGLEPAATKNAPPTCGRMAAGGAGPDGSPFGRGSAPGRASGPGAVRVGAGAEGATAAANAFVAAPAAAGADPRGTAHGRGAELEGTEVAEGSAMRGCNLGQQQQQQQHPSPPPPVAVQRTHGPPSQPSTLPIPPLVKPSAATGPCPPRPPQLQQVQPIGPQHQVQLQPQAERATRRQLRKRPRWPPDHIDVLQLLGDMWQVAGEASEGLGAGREPWGRTAAAEAAAKQMDAWMAVFGVGPLEDWWRDLGELELFPDTGRGSGPGA